MTGPYCVFDTKADLVPLDCQRILNVYSFVLVQVRLNYLQVSDNVELLCIFLYFIVFIPFLVNLLSVIYMKDVENVS